MAKVLSDSEYSAVLRSECRCKSTTFWVFLLPRHLHGWTYLAWSPPTGQCLGVVPNPPLSAAKGQCPSHRALTPTGPARAPLNSGPPICFLSPKESLTPAAHPELCAHPWSSANWGGGNQIRLCAWPEASQRSPQKCTSTHTYSGRAGAQGPNLSPPWKPPPHSPALGGRLGGPVEPPSVHVLFWGS